MDTIRTKFTGHERDLANPAGVGDDLDYRHARFGSPVVGRFLSVDPELNARAAMKAPQRWNRYAYTVDNPMRLVDLDGREAIAFIVGPSKVNDPKGILGHSALYVTSKKGTAGISWGRGYASSLRSGSS